MKQLADNQEATRMTPIRDCYKMMRARSNGRRASLSELKLRLFLCRW